jgi:dolichol-phosphate mannosyltransferase
MKHEESAASDRGLQLSVIVPPFSERDNVSVLVDRLERVLDGLRWEVVFVDDDSPDGTADVVREMARSRAHVRCLHRIGRRGVSRAVIEGALATTSPIIVVLDADLQHDESLIPEMLEQMRHDTLDMVVASRYCRGGSIGSWDPARARMSGFATSLARFVVNADLTDPMSGFFMIRREAFMATARRLSGEGYKILLDIFASSRTPLRFVELPYEFRARVAGESKLDSAVMWEYLLLLIDKKFGQVVSPRFVLFSLVGFSGLLVHFLTLWVMYDRVGFATAQAAATVVAMTSNYAINNVLTYRDSRRRGWRFLTGLLSFYFVCGIGAIANVGVANAVFVRNHTWWIAGGAGVVVGTVWNYVASSAFTWGRR